MHAGQAVLAEPHLMVITFLHVNTEVSSMEKKTRHFVILCWSPGILFHFVVFVEEQGNVDILIKMRYMVENYSSSINLLFLKTHRTEVTLPRSLNYRC